MRGYVKIDLINSSVGIRFETQERFYSFGRMVFMRTSRCGGTEDRVEQINERGVIDARRLCRADATCFNEIASRFALLLIFDPCKRTIAFVKKK